MTEIPKSVLRNEALEKIGWAMGTLKSLVSTIDIGEPHPRAADEIQKARTSAVKQILRIRQQLDILERAL